MLRAFEIGACGALILLAMVTLAHAGDGAAVARGSFPVTMQFSSVPDGRGWSGAGSPLTQEAIDATIDNMIRHGVTGLYCPVYVYPPNNISPEDAKKVEERAQSRGMSVTYQTGGLELFGRSAPPSMVL